MPAACSSQEMHPHSTPALLHRLHGMILCLSYSPLQFSPPFHLPGEGHEPSQGSYSHTPGRSLAAPSSTCLRVHADVVTLLWHKLGVK